MTQKTPGAIAAGHPQTAEAGLEILRAGGNAFDAAVAAMLASFVTEPGLTSAAGGGFLLAHTGDRRNLLFDFFVQTPRQKKPVGDIDFYPVSVNFGDAVQEFHVGLGSMGVPGALAGAFRVLERLGTLPFRVVAEPAIAYARQGVVLNDYQSYCLLQILRPIVIDDRAGPAIYTPTGEAIAPGRSLRMPEFANTLEYLAATGVGEFYRGEIARQLVADCRERGGHLTLEDLQGYRVIERQPVCCSYRDRLFLSNPPPSSGGTLIAFALQLLSGIELNSLQFGGEAHLHAIARVMQLTNRARQERFDRHLHRPDIAEAFLSVDGVGRYRDRLRHLASKWGSTTHISVVDGQGNAASVTASNGEGSSYVIPGTGIMVNNMLGEADLNPAGFHQWPENTRLSSMMAPSLLLRDRQVEAVLGSGGSNRIRTAILQVISNLLDFNMPVDGAVDAPRVHWEEGTFHLEPGFDAETRAKLQLPETDRVVPWMAKGMFFGGVHAVVRSPTGELEAVGDRRRGGGAGQLHKN